MVAPAVAAAAVLGKEILDLIVKVGGSPEGLDWIGRQLKDKVPALRARIRANEKVPVAKEAK